MMMIQAINLTKIYGRKVAVEDLNFSIDSGEILGFLGPNGAGKTTTLRMITTFLRPTSGTVLVQGIDGRKHPLAVRKKIGYLPENAPSYPEMTVEEYLKFRMKLKGVKNRKEEMDGLVEKCSLEDVRHQLIGELSKGYSQRVGFAEALCARPPLLILDEPTSGMDPLQKREIRQLIKELAKDHTILFSSHLLSEVEQLCTRVVIIHQGRLVALGTPQELQKKIVSHAPVLVQLSPSSQKNPQEKIEAEFKNLVPSFELIQKEKIQMDGKEELFFTYRLFPSEDSEKQDDLQVAVYQRIRKKKWQLRTLKQEEKNLEDVFIQLTGAKDHSNANTL